MTPREKAMEIVGKFMKYEPTKMSDYTRIEYPSVINLAKICVDEIIGEIKSGYKYEWINERRGGEEFQTYWEEVKNELENL